MDELERAIKKTIDYGHRYKAEYNAEEISKRLISSKVFSRAQILKNVEKKKIYYSPHYNAKMALAKNLTKKISQKFKTILLIGVTGSVAAGRPIENSDIDLIIITEANTLWLTRLTLRAYIFWHRIPHRLYGKSEKGNEFCFNLWLDEKALEIPPRKQVLKNAMDMILMEPLLNRDEVYEKFINSNKWVTSYVATGYHQISSKIKKTVRRKAEFSKIISWLNKLAYWLQYAYMKQKINGELIDEHRAFFHPETLE